MKTLYTTAQVASLIKRTKVTVLRRAQSRKMRAAVRGLQWNAPGRIERTGEVMSKETVYRLWIVPVLFVQGALVGSIDNAVHWQVLAIGLLTGVAGVAAKWIYSERACRHERKGAEAN